MGPCRSKVERPLKLCILFYLDVVTSIVNVLRLEAEVSDVDLALVHSEVVGLNVPVNMSKLVQLND